MAPKVYNVGTARRELPRLVREVTEGRRAVAIGPRGEPAAILVSVTEYEALRARAAATPLHGWGALELELVGTPDELEADLRDLRDEATSALKKRAVRIAPRPKRL